MSERRARAWLVRHGGTEWSGLGRHTGRTDIPLADRGRRRGSVVGSWLLDLTAAALLEDPGLEGFNGRVADSGEGRWTVMAAVEEGVPAHVLSAALISSYRQTRGRS